MSTTTTREYTLDEVERINPADLRTGDLLCHATADVGANRFTARLVTWRQYGTTPGTGTGVWDGPSVRYTLAGMVQSTTGRPYEWNQPVGLPLYVVRRDLNEQASR